MRADIILPANSEKEDTRKRRKTCLKLKEINQGFQKLKLPVMKNIQEMHQSCVWCLYFPWRINKMLKLTTVMSEVLGRDKYLEKVEKENSCF